MSSGFRGIKQKKEKVSPAYHPVDVSAYPEDDGDMGKME
jgi:hypothetical protein